MRNYLVALCFGSLAGFAHGSPSDYERYGSAAWQSARSNEMSARAYSAITPNRPTTVDMSAFKATLERYFDNANANRSPAFDPYDTYGPGRVSAHPPPQPTEEEIKLGQARAGNVKSMKWLADYYHGQPGHPAALASLSWHEAAAKKGDIDSMMQAYYLQMNNAEQMLNLPRAMSWLKAAADAGEVHALDQYAERLRTGDGIEKNMAAAFPYALKSAQTGYPLHYIRVADMYMAGEGTAKNPTEAIFWYRKAMASQDRHEENRRAHLNLARLLVENAGGVAKNQAEIIAVLDPVRSVGVYPPATLYYAQLKESGELPPQDLKAARDAYESLEAAPQTDFMVRRLAEDRIGSLYFATALAPSDRAKARKFGFDKLRTGGDDTFRPVELGYLLLDPSLGEPEKEWAYVCFDAHPDQPEALRESALLLRAGNPEEASARMEKAAGMGDALSARFLADYKRFFADHFFYRGRADFDRDSSRVWAKKGADLGDPDSKARLGGWLLEDSRLIADDAVAKPMREEGIAILQPLVEQKNAYALARMGDAYQNGVGVRRDDESALRHLQQAAQLGSNYAKVRIALAEYQGLGSPIDKPAALQLITAEVPASPYAKALRGEWLVRGDAGTQDIAGGTALLRSAAEEGEWRCWLELARINHAGVGQKANEETAALLVANAAEAGGEFGLLAAAEAFETGAIVNPDLHEAERLYGAAANISLGRNAGHAASFCLRHGDKSGAKYWADQGVAEGNAESIEIKAQADAVARVAAERILRAELPDAGAKIDRSLDALETAARALQQRAAPFDYDTPDPDTVTASLELLPVSAERQLVLAARDLALAEKGMFNNGVSAYSELVAFDSKRAQRCYTILRNILLKDAESGNSSAMVEIVFLDSPADEFQTKTAGKWPANDREAIHWARQALLAGEDRAVANVLNIYSGETKSNTDNPEMAERWQTLDEELPRPQSDNPDFKARAALIAAYAKAHLLPETSERVGLK